MSQEDLAAAVSSDQGAISEYENGKRKLPAADIPLFATALEVPITYFFEPEIDPSLDAAILNYFHQLPSSEDQQAAIDILRIFSTRMNTR